MENDMIRVEGKEKEREAGNLVQGLKYVKLLSATDTSPTPVVVFLSNL